MRKVSCEENTFSKTNLEKIHQIVYDKSYDFSQTAYHVYLSDSTGLGIPAIYQDSLIVLILPILIV